MTIQWKSLGADSRRHDKKGVIFLIASEEIQFNERFQEDIKLN